jgi:hypothetical protein
VKRSDREIMEILEALFDAGVTRIGGAAVRRGPEDGAPVCGVGSQWSPPH